MQGDEADTSSDPSGSNATGGNGMGANGMRLRVRLLSGDVRHLPLRTHTGSIGNALDRLEDWIETDEGSWIQKRWIVEATAVQPGS